MESVGISMMDGNMVVILTPDNKEYDWYVTDKNIGELLVWLNTKGKCISPLQFSDVAGTEQ